MRPIQRVPLVVLAALLGVLMGLGVAQAKHLGLDGKEDFGQVARKGFAETVQSDGTFLSNGIGSTHNSYAWSGAWFNGKFYVGTARDVDCFLGSGGGSGCPPPGTITMTQAAEIWAYTPTSYGEKGTWARVLQSPQFSPLLLPGAPRDIGYRGMALCNANGTAAGSATPRLYIAAFGLGGHMLSTANGTTFQVASSVGLQNGLLQLQNGTAELGYRALLCWKGRLWTAPSGSDTDTDLPPVGREVVLANANQSSTSSTWQTIVNVKTHPTLGDLGNLGVFEMAVFNGYLYLGVTNRTTGFEIWKGDATNCALPPGACTITWTKIIDNGGGRPLGSNGFVANAGASAMKAFNNALYIGVSDTAGNNSQPAELIRINTNDTWDLIMGVPRLQSTMAGFPAFNCNLLVGDPDGTGPLTSNNWCLPLSGRGAGFGDSNGTPSLTAGNARYVWRLEPHDDGFGLQLYAGTLDLGAGSGGSGVSGGGGFSLLRSPNGDTAWTFVDKNGFGNTNNGGVRTLVSVPGGAGGWPGGNALVLASANFTSSTSPGAGCEVFVGTCGPASSPAAVLAIVTQARQASPYKNQVIFDAANSRYVAFDDDNAPSLGNGSVTVTLDGSGSYATFCGDLLHYEWQDKLGNYSGPAGHVVSSGDTAGGLKLTIPPLPLTLATGPDSTDYTFTLCVTDEFSHTDCEDVKVTASHNLPPTAQIIATPPATPGGSSGTLRVTLIDLDGNGSETLTMQGSCSDPEGSLASCTWSADAGVTIGGLTPPLENTLASYQVTVPITTGGSGSSGSNIFLTATDGHGYTFQRRVRVRVQAAAHDVAVTAVTPPTPPVLQGSAQSVTVTVVNNGHFAERFNVALVDATGGTVSPVTPQPVNLAECVNTTSYPGHAIPLSPCPTQSVLFTWTPTKASLHTLTATAATVTGETNTADNSLGVQVTVTPVSDPPVATNDTATTKQNTPVTIAVLTNDSDPNGDPISVASVTQPANGTVVLNANNTVTYTPKTNFAGQDSFTYRAKDPSNAVSNAATVTVTVTATTKPPAPTGVTAAVTGTRLVHVAWADTPNEASYDVQRCKLTGSSCPYSAVATGLPANTTGYDNSVPAAGTYRFRVRACNAKGCSGFAESSNVVVP